MTTATVTESSLEMIFIVGKLTGWRHLSSVFYKEELSPQSGLTVLIQISSFYKGLSGTF